MTFFTKHAGEQRGNKTSPDRHLSPPEACRYLGEKYGIKRAVRTLAKLRCVRSDGPVFIRSNRAILYPVAGLDEYARATMSAPMRSTSDRQQEAA